MNYRRSLGERRKFFAHFGTWELWPLYTLTSSAVSAMGTEEFEVYEVQVDWALQKHPSDRWAVRAYAVRNSRRRRDSGHWAG